VTNPIVEPRAPSSTNIPSLLALFQNEWDALMLESYSIKSQLESCRQELANALFQYDAACRVIANLIKERDDLKRQ
jgi:pre-mRNA-processing factor 19